MFELSNFLKQTFFIEAYFLNLPLNNQRIFSQFRCRNYQLTIETGARHNIPRDMRYCTFCETGEIGHEYHYILKISCQLKNIMPMLFNCKLF